MGGIDDVGNEGRCLENNERMAYFKKEPDFAELAL